MSHYKPYPAYKDSGVEWLGKVPEQWGVIGLSRLLETQVTDGPHETPEFLTDGVPFLSVDGIQDGELIFDGKRFISEEDHQRFSKKAKPRINDILLGKAASVGKIARVKTNIDFNIWSPLALIRVNQINANPSFVEYSLKSTWLQAQTETKANLNTQFNLGMKDIAKLLLCLPTLIEQASIAAHLDRETTRIDTLIAKKTRFIELLTEKRQALITQVVTKGLNPNVKMKDSGVEWLGEVPEHWAVKPLKLVANVQTGIAKGKDNTGLKTIEVPYLRVANVQDGYLNLVDVATIEIPVDVLSRYLLQPGDVLMNEGGDFDKLGRGHIWNGEIQSCIHQNHVFAVRPHGVSSHWLNTFTGSAAAQFYFMRQSKQSTNLASISSSNLMELMVPLPPDEEVAQISSHLDRETTRIDTLLQKSQLSITLLKERRSALITAAVTGQIDLREAA